MTTTLRRMATAAGFILALAASGCVTMSVSSHLERNTDFTQYRTWDWGPADTLPTGDPRLDSNPFFKDHFEGAVEKALVTKGLRRAAVGTQADLIVHYHANISQRFQVNEPSPNCGTDCEVSVIEYDQGTLVIDMVDGKTTRLVWRGWAQDSVNGTIDRQDRLEQQINEAVTKMMARFPRAL